MIRTPEGREKAKKELSVCLLPREHVIDGRKKKIRVNRAARANVLGVDVGNSPVDGAPHISNPPPTSMTSHPGIHDHGGTYQDAGPGIVEPAWDELEMIGNVPPQGIPMRPTSTTMNNDTTAQSSAYGGNNFEEVWNLIFGQQHTSPLPAQSSNTMQTQNTLQSHYEAYDPSYTDSSLVNFFTSPSPARPISSMPGVSMSPAVPDLTYLHHYLNIVLPLQYRFVVKSFADLVAPLALSNPEILKSTSALAALHMAAQKGRGHARLPWGDEPDTERNFAMVTHKETINRLRFISPSELTSESVVLPALFALSFYLFSGGTARDWTEALAVSRRCLSAAFTASPEITGEAGIGVDGMMGGILGGGNGMQSPWKRYRPLMCAMVWMDIVGSVSQNKSTRLLPIYRTVLAQPPSGWNGGRAKLHMERVVGCDDTTVSRAGIASLVPLSPDNIPPIRSRPQHDDAHDQN